MTADALPVWLGRLLIVLAIAVPMAATVAWPFRQGGGRRPYNWLVWIPLPALAAAVAAPDETMTWSWLLLEMQIGLDVVGRMFLGVTALIWGAAAWSLRSYHADERLQEGFGLFFLLAMLGNLGVILAHDAVSFYAFFAVMSLSSYGLIVATGDGAAIRAGRVYIYLVVLGEVVLFAALAAAAASAGSTDIQEIKTAVAESPYRDLLALAILAAFGVKTGLLLFHYVLPLSYAAAPIPAAVVLAGSMINAGVLGWMQFLPVGDAALAGPAALMLLLGVSAAFYGVLIGLTQHDPKSVLAYSSISQMGLVLLPFGFALQSPEISSAALAVVAVYVPHHALAKSVLFSGVDAVMRAPDAVRRRRVQLAMLLPAAVMAGLPLTSGAFAKTALKILTGDAPGAWAESVARLLPISSVATTLLMARYVYLLHRLPRAGTDGYCMVWQGWMALMAAMVAGVWVWPAASPYAAAWLADAKLWSSVWPIALGSGLAFIAWRAGQKYDLRLPRVPRGDMIVWIEKATGLAAALARVLTGRLSAVARRSEDAARRFHATLIVPDSLGTVESRLGAWGVFGVLMLALIVLLFIMLQL